MADVQVVPVESRRDLDAFVAFPYALFRHDPVWVPALRRDVRAKLSPSDPFFEHAEACYFLARRGAEVVGRIAAIHNRAHNDFHGDKVGFFGFFECVDDDAVAGALFAAAAGWLRARGLERMRGPANFSTNDETGLLVDGFDTPPVLMMTHNPRRYVDHVERAGFTKARDLFAYQTTPAHTDLEGPLLRRLRQAAGLLMRRYDIKMRMVDMSRLRRSWGWSRRSTTRPGSATGASSR